MKKTITILGKEYLYELVSYDCGPYGGDTCYNTYFYNPTPIIKTRKKYLLWGPEIEYSEYEQLFIIHCNIESSYFTKEEITKKILKEVALLNRADEIQRGEIIASENTSNVDKYTNKDMTSFVSFVGKNYIKAKGFYYMKGDFEKKHRVSIHQILDEFKKKIW
jgi:hypothetical protein